MEIILCFNPQLKWLLITTTTHSHCDYNPSHSTIGLRYLYIKRERWWYLNPSLKPYVNVIYWRLTNLDNFYLMSKQKNIDPIKSLGKRIGFNWAQGYNLLENLCLRKEEKLFSSALCGQMQPFLLQVDSTFAFKFLYSLSLLKLTFS